MRACVGRGGVEGWGYVFWMDDKHLLDAAIADIDLFSRDITCLD